MNFLNRVKFYIFGLLIGVFISYLFFGNRGCGGWLPGNRIKTAISEHILLSNNYIDCQLKNEKITFDSIARFVELSTVNLKKSITNTSPRTYLLQNGKKELYFMVNFEDSTVYLKPNFTNKFNCDSGDTKFYKCPNTLKTLRK